MSLVVFSPSTLNQLFVMANHIAGWVFVIAIAIVGAIFIGMFISHRLLTHGGFTPFEEEMLRMRHEVTESREHLKRLREEVGVMRMEVARVRRSPRGEAHARSEGAEAGSLDDALTAPAADAGEDAAEVDR